MNEHRPMHLPPINRRTTLQLMGAAAVVPAVAKSGGLLADRSGHGPAGGAVSIVAGGRPRAVVVVPADPDPQVQNAIDVLVDCVKSSSGAVLPVSAEADLGAQYEGWTRVYVGSVGSQGDQTVPPLLTGLDPDGYVIKAGGAMVTVVGPSVWGTRFGVYEFLERFLGVRWLLPGPDGTDVPASSDISVPAQTIRDAPAISSRNIYNLGSGTSLTTSNVWWQWGVFLRAHSNSSYSHNVGHIFDPAVYGNPAKPDTYHPEFYPIINGERRIPATATLSGWQPRYTEPGTIPVAIDYCLTQLRDPSSSGWVSLGINDNGGYSDEEWALATLDQHGQYSFSKIYYTWVNAVAEGVAAAYSGEFHLGLLAYNEVRAAPSFRLHPSVVPYITRDRYGWVDKRVAEADQQVLQSWGERASSSGWWDYPWGGPYTAPRMYGRALGAALTYGARHGLNGVFAEMNPTVGEGPKAWVYSKLLWDPERDPDRLRADWCQHAVGERAAPELIGYFRLWEHLWSHEVPRTAWFRAGGGNRSYYFYLDPGYMEVVTPDLITRSRRLLESVAEKTQTAAQSARAQLMLTGFEYYEASGLSYPRRTPALRNASQARHLLDDTVAGLDSAVAYAAKRQTLLDEFVADPVLKLSNGIVSGLIWPGWNLYTLWDVAVWIREHAADARSLRQHVQALASGSSSAEVRGYTSLLLDIADGKTRQLALNPSFEDGVIDPWLDEHAGPHRLPTQVSTAVAHEGSTSLRVSGPSGGLSQLVPAKPGFFRASFWFYTAHDDPANGSVVPTWLAYDEAGKLSQLYRGEEQPLADTRGAWAESVMAQMLPDDVASIRCYLSKVEVGVDTTIYVDDISFTQTTT